MVQQVGRFDVARRLSCQLPCEDFRFSGKVRSSAKSILKPEWQVMPVTIKGFLDKYLSPAKNIEFSPLEILAWAARIPVINIILDTT